MRRVVLVALLFLGACGDGGDAGPAQAASACGADTGEAPDPGSIQHVLPGAPEPAYLTDPPSSGAHLAGGAVGGVQAAPLARPVQVAVLEAGGIVVQHDGLDAAGRRRLEALAGPDVVVSPNPDLAAPVVATAWGRRLTCGGAGTDAVAAVERFVAAHRGGGPGH